MIAINSKLSVVLLSLFCILACNKKGSEEGTLFIERHAKDTGIDFANSIQEDSRINIYNYEYLYNGGGVGVGDINNDGLPDIFLTSTLGSNKLYLNKGGLKFEDITKSAGVGLHISFSTGVTMIDINQDGYLDIYVCQTGIYQPEDRRNMLYINQKDNTFKNEAQAYGLDDASFSNHATFFDYDHDGDLDMYLVNHPLDFKYANTVILAVDTVKQYSTNMLYRNNGNNTFTNVSAAAGVDKKAYSFCASVIDVNNDGWEDVFVSNDYLMGDFLMINQKDGTFKESIQSYMKHSSWHSMGNAITDVNNDGDLDIYILDMVAEDNYRQKMLGGMPGYDGYLAALKYGYQNQYLENCLQLNRGDGTFSEVGQLAGIAQTDWSWAPVFADFDKDGNKDVIVSNGYMRDVTNMDYARYYLDSIKASGNKDLGKILQSIPQTPLLNYMYQNQGNLKFVNKSKEWGITTPTFSNGTIVADLDGDGDEDVIMNNVNTPVIIYENQASKLRKDNDYISIQLEGTSPNKQGLGALITITTDSFVQADQITCTHSYYSSGEPKVYFGLGKNNKIKDVTVRWPGGKLEQFEDLRKNKLNTLEFGKGKMIPKEVPAKPMFEDVSKVSGIAFVHHENEFIDFKENPTISQKFSIEGPAMATGDVNGDGLTDVYLGGAKDQAAVLYVQSNTGQFSIVSQPAFANDASFEDVGAAFFDVDKDGDLDLYVASGGAEWEAGNAKYQDRQYLNNGKGIFQSTNLPIETNSGSCVVPGDIDGDGDMDLFVGGRVLPGKYPMPATSIIWINENGKLVNKTDTWCPALKDIGLLTSAVWQDLNNDKKPDLILSGQWMPIKIFYNTGTSLQIDTKANGLEKSDGWWYSLASADMDGDGDMDLIAGNMGLNSRIKAKVDEPACVYGYDWDENGTMDPIMCIFYQGVSHPIHNRDQLTDQVRSLRKKLLRYQTYANATMQDIFPKEQLDKALVLNAFTFATTYFENKGNGVFFKHELPVECQFAPVKSIQITDVNQDKHLDVIMVGNGYEIEYETGRYDASQGVVLLGDGKGGFKSLRKSGLKADLDARHAEIITGAGGNKRLLVGNNNAGIQMFAY
ncbi:MAG: VCBS repeat-containing protein [Saprospiraceae bacterium]